VENETGKFPAEGALLFLAAIGASLMGGHGWEPARAAPLRAFISGVDFIAVPE